MEKIFGTYLMMALNMINDLKTRSEERKKEILVEWERSKNYPRKKKKIVRKNLELDWRIANFDPFNGLLDF